MTLVTGFLGSGKTTLINAALRSPELAKTVVVVNEFGEVGLDHQLFASSSDSVVVLENGCLCCTVRSDLVGTLNSLYHARQAGEIPAFDNVVIETSGLAEPGPVLQAFLSEPTLDGLYRVASVLTLVDAVNWSGTSEAHEESVRQVALADQIRITKLDMVTGDRQNGCIADSARSPPDQPVSRDRGGRLVVGGGRQAARRLRGSTRPTRRRIPVRGSMWKPIKILPMITTRAATIIITKVIITSMIMRCDAHSHHLEGRGIENFVLVRESPLAREEAQFLLDGIAQNLGAGLLRVKGLVNIAEEPGRPAVIQGAQHLLHTMTWLDRWPDSDHRTRIVFITQGIPRESLKDIIDLLDRVSLRTFKARARGRKALEAARTTTPTE